MRYTCNLNIDSDHGRILSLFLRHKIHFIKKKKDYSGSFIVITLKKKTQLLIGFWWGKQARKHFFPTFVFEVAINGCTLCFNDDNAQDESCGQYVWRVILQISVFWCPNVTVEQFGSKVDSGQEISSGIFGPDQPTT